jgi:hypothetical protein
VPSGAGNPEFKPPSHQKKKKKTKQNNQSKNGVKEWFKPQGSKCETLRLNPNSTKKRVYVYMLNEVNPIISQVRKENTENKHLLV